MRSRRFVIALLAVVVLALFTAVLARERPYLEPPRDDPRAQELSRTARVILVTLDGPVVGDVLTGPLLRTLHEAVDREGVLFPAKVTSPYALSLPGYQVLATGQKTDCLDNDCARVGVETLGEGLARRLGLPPDQIAVFASWSRQRRAASSRDGVIHVDAPEDQQPQEPGPPWRNARWDTETFTRARAHWQAHHPRFLHLALLDTDEWAHEGLREDYERALRETDARLGEILGWVSALPEDERRHTTVLITADHGRGRSDWREHGFFDRGSDEIFIAAIGSQGRGPVDPRAEQRDVRPTVERLFGLCPAREGDGRALEAIVGGLPCH